MFRASLIALLSLPLVSCLAQTTSPTAPATPPATTPAATVATTSAAAKTTYSQCHVDGPFIAMTFDDGPHATNTPRLLEILKKRNIKATFFVVGECAAQYPAIMKRIVAEGHEIGNHSWSHPLLSSMGEGAVTDQLQRTHDAIVNSTGVVPTLMRPPFGGFTANQRAWAHKKWGYKTILWDVDPLDWKVRNAAHVQSEIERHTVNGSIILSHDIHKSTVDAMSATLDNLAAKGFKFVTVTELLAMDRPLPAKPPVVAKPKTAPGAKIAPAPVEPVAAEPVSVPAEPAKEALKRPAAPN